MTANVRLILSALMILVSALYGLLTVQDPETASAVSLGYIGILATVILFTNVRKKP